MVGRENIPKQGGVILAGNHTNYFDCLMLMSSTKRCIHFMAKQELCHGFKKVIFCNMGLIPVNRKQKDPESLKCACACLRESKVVGIFPEGTTEKETGVMLPFRIGAVKMAHDTGVPIVPFGISGKYRLFSRDLTIVFGEPFMVESDQLDGENEKLKDLVSNMKRG